MHYHLISSSIVFTCALTICPLALQAQTTWYVDDDCIPPGSGTVGDPFCKIQDGLDAALNGDTVSVADGIYTGLGNKNLSFGGKAICLRFLNEQGGCVIADSNGGNDGGITCRGCRIGCSH